MPEATAALQSPEALIRCLIYGPAKVRKTLWSLMAAAQGFNVVLLQGEDNLPLNLLPAAALERIKILDFRDELNDAVFCKAVYRLLKGEEFVWDEQSKTTVQPFTKLDPAHSYAVIDPSKLTHNDVLVVDTWTALTQSMLLEFAHDNKIDVLNDIDGEQFDKFKGYAWFQRMADLYMIHLRQLPCHVIVVAHQQVYEKKIVKKNSRDRWETQVEWTRIQPRSTSSAQGPQMAKEFTDVLYFSLVGETTKISTGPSADRDGGAINLPPQTSNWDTLPFIQLIKGGGLLQPLPETKCSGVNFLNYEQVLSWREGNSLKANPAVSTTVVPLDGKAPPVQVQIPGAKTSMTAFMTAARKG